MAINSLPGKKFFLVTAAAVLGVGIVASFIVPSANASKSVSDSVVTAPAVVTDSNLPSSEVTGIDCNNGIDSTGAQCDGGPAANTNDVTEAPQSSSESQNETTASVDGDNIQS